MLALTVLIAATIFVSPSTPVVQAQGPGSGMTSLVLQNLDPYSTMNAKVTYFDTNGLTLLSTLRTIAPYRSMTIDQPAQLGLPTNFGGSGTLDADTPFAGVIMEYNGVASNLGTSFRMDGYTAWPGTDASNTAIFTQLLKNIYDPGSNATYNSRLIIQNSNPAAATVTITFTLSTGQAYVHSGITIPQNGSYSDPIDSDPALSGLSTFFGMGRVSSTQPVAAIVRHSATGILMSNSGLTGARADSTLYLTQLLKSIYDPLSGRTWSSGIIATTLDGTSANVTLTYKSIDGSTYTDAQTAAPMALFDQRYSGVLPATFYGTGVLTSTKPIVATVNFNTNYDAVRGLSGSIYRAFPLASGGTRVFLPMLKKNAVDTNNTGAILNSGVMGRLIGSSATTVMLTLYLPTGTLQRTYAVSPSSPIFSFDQRYDAGLADGSSVSGLLTTNPAQPIIATVNIAADGSVLGDTIMTYEGIAQ